MSYIDKQTEQAQLLAAARFIQSHCTLQEDGCCYNKECPFMAKRCIFAGNPPKRWNIPPTLDDNLKVIAKENIHKEYGGSGPWVTSDGTSFFWDDPEFWGCTEKESWQVSNQEFEKADAAAYDAALKHEISWLQTNV